MKIHTYNQLSPFDCIEIQSFLQYVKGRLSNKLIAAKLKDLTKEYPEEDKIIDYIEKTIIRIYDVEKGGTFLLKEAIKSATIITGLENEKWALKQKVELQQKEIENLKQNLTI